MSTQKKSNREIKRDKIKALQKKKSIITNINTDMKKDKNALVDKVATLEQQLGNMRISISTKLNKIDSFQDSLDGALQGIDAKVNMIAQDLHNSNEKIDSMMEILLDILEEETDDEKSDNKDED